MAPKRKREVAKKKAVLDEAHEDGKDVNHSVLGGMRDPTLNSKIIGNGANEDNSAQPFSVPYGDKTIICERRGGKGTPALLLTHGAGGGLANPGTRDFAVGFAETRPLVCFQGASNLQSRVKYFHSLVEHEKGSQALGGSSMGARAAVIAATESETNIKSLVLVSYPLIGGKNSDRRDQILYDLPKDKDVLFVVGSKDTMCPLNILEEVMQKMTNNVWTLVVDGADHGMSLKLKNTVETLRRKTGSLAATWLHDPDSLDRRSVLNWDDTNEVFICRDANHVPEEVEVTTNISPRKKRKAK